MGNEFIALASAVIGSLIIAFGVVLFYLTRRKLQNFIQKQPARQHELEYDKDKLTGLKAALNDCSVEEKLLLLNDMLGCNYQAIIEVDGKHTEIRAIWRDDTRIYEGEAELHKMTG